jgi:crotonobetainyl-CoA:carnitine CoA-transferase CaiB-like acyl-CoA transferase
MYLALVMAALIERERSGQGQWVQTSLLEAMIAMLDFQATRWLIGGEIPPQAGNDHPTAFPMGVFPAKDGMVNIAASGDPMWRDPQGHRRRRAGRDERWTPGARQPSRQLRAEVEVNCGSTPPPVDTGPQRRQRPCGPILLSTRRSRPQVNTWAWRNQIHSDKYSDLTLVRKPGSAVSHTDFLAPRAASPPALKRKRVRVQLSGEEIAHLQGRRYREGTGRRDDAGGPA